MSDRVNGPFNALFIDTIDQQPPAPDGSNLANINIQGNSDGYKGFFYLCANLDISGSGNPSGMQALNPDGNTESLAKVFLDGVLYTPGYVDVSGNPVTYGAVIAETGVQGTGTMDVYYDPELKNGLPFEDGNIGSRMQILRQDNFATGW